MERNSSQRMVFAAQVLPPVVLLAIIYLLTYASPRVGLALSVALFVLLPIAAFVEIAALVVAFFQWRSGQSRGAKSFVSFVIGVPVLVGTVCLLFLFLGGGGV
jgi:hypothetical protein